MVGRRAVLTGASTVGIASIAGCLDLITGENPVEFEAAPSRVASAALDDTGYELAEVEEVIIEREFEAAGETREVVVTNVQAEYEKAIDMGPLGQQEGAVFTSLTTPQVRVLGQEFNPVAEMSTEELAEMVQDQYDDIRDLDHEGDSEVTIHGETTTQSKFRAEATLAGDAVELFLHISEAVEMGEDLVVTVGGYPDLTPEEEDNILHLMESVEPDD